MEKDILKKACVGSSVQRLAYQVTTKRKRSDSITDNLLNMNFNPVGPNQVWASDISYLEQTKAGCI